MKNIHTQFKYDKDIEAITGGLDANFREQLVTGLSGTAKNIVFGQIVRETGRPIMVVTHSLLQAQKVLDDLAELLPDRKVSLFPVNDLIAAESSFASPEFRAARIEVLSDLAKKSDNIIVVPVAGLRKVLPSKSRWKSNLLTVGLGSDIDLDAFASHLAKIGYNRSHMVDTPGEFSIRGGIIDIYPLTEENPIRIELFDTEVDSIRSFNIETQRSINNLEEMLIVPTTELFITEQEAEGLADKIRLLAKKSITRRSIEEEGFLEATVEADCEKLISRRSGDVLFKYFSLLEDETSDILNYFPENGIIVFDEVNKVFEANDQVEKDDAEYVTSLLEHKELVKGAQLTRDFSSLFKANRRPIVHFSLFMRHVPNTSPQNIVNFTCKPMQAFHGQMNLFKVEFDRWKKSGYTVIIQGTNEANFNKLERVFEDFNIDKNVLINPESIVPSAVQIVNGGLQSGFELPMQKLVLVTEQEMFNQKTRKNFSRQKLSNAERIRNYSELAVGDYVVHVNHGVGKYLGIETLIVDGLHKDFLNIQYAGTDTLFIPTDQIDAIQKYVASEGKEPKIYKLGGSDWKKVREKVRRSVEDIADDLIKLYAEREVARGFAFSSDNDLLNQFETSFAYQETDDQLRSINEIKKDMEKERPMDRLLCGDVGYGKTEVAIRAAFKAACDDKQVAILVPTTILAQQHYETIRERFRDFPITVSLMSRFRTKQQQEETIKQLKSGTVDVVVGTHRVLSKDVEFKDLGLIVIDEEQRFGVKHKERLKQLKSSVDVLTLTATPIPRTLHMSMLGVRDLSVIETPPANRFPIQTYVLEQNNRITREAIEREIARDGQVFVLHNRVHDISGVAADISALVPDARVAYAHGQMTESQLESILYSFINKEIDVLVSTTIIETGVDIPNANTLIINDADKMGLSTLYQLRGRVGRSNRVAYAYFTYQRDKVLSEAAEKRLQAIKEFTELGSGFKIAMRDLSIRGAGNLLGAQQHGFIDSVGFDMYSHMLSEAINRRRGIEPEEKVREIEINLRLDAYIPDTYIGNSNHKIQIYKMFKAVSTMDELDEIQDELIDRFGDYPEEVQHLIQVSEIKVHGRKVGLESLRQASKTEVVAMISEDFSCEIDGGKMFEATSKYGRMIGLQLTNNKKIRISFDIRKMSSAKILMTISEVLEKIQECKKDK